MIITQGWGNQLKKLLGTGLLALMVSASAQSATNNYYVTVGAGGVFPVRNSSFTANSSSILYSPTAIGTSLFSLPDTHWQNSFHNGYDANIALGYQFTPNWRSDIEFLYQHFIREVGGNYNWLEQFPATGATYATSMNNPISSRSTSTNVCSLLANAYYDFNNNSHWTPHLGAGIGIAWIDSNSTSGNNTLTVDDPNTPLFETAPIMQHSPSIHASAFAWQMKVGVNYDYSHETSFIIQYRLFGTGTYSTGSSSMTSNPGTAGESTFSIGSQKIEGLLTNVLEVGAKFNL